MPRMREAMRSDRTASSASSLLADAHQHDRLARDLAHRQRGAAARVAIGLGEDHAGQFERRAERARGIHRVLAGHAVDDEQPLVRLDRALDLAAPRP